MQILHAGRYAFNPLCVAPSAIKSPISRFKPRALGGFGIRKLIRDFANTARLAKRAGYRLNVIELRMPALRAFIRATGYRGQES